MLEVRGLGAGPGSAIVTGHCLKLRVLYLCIRMALYNKYNTLVVNSSKMQQQEHSKDDSARCGSRLDFCPAVPRGAPAAARARGVGAEDLASLVASLGREICQNMRKYVY